MDDPHATTAGEVPPDFTTKLPNELKTEIASYLSSTRDRKALTLVSKDWALVVLPILWETFNTDQELNEDRQLCALTDAGSNIIMHVKHVVSNTPFYSETRAAREYPTSSWMPMLLALIPHNQLRGYTSSKKSIDVDDSVHLLTVLQVHNIQELVIPAIAWFRLTAVVRTFPNLTNLTRLTVDPAIDAATSPFYLRDIDFQLKQIRHLEFVDFMSFGHWSTREIDFDPDPRNWSRVNGKDTRKILDDDYVQIFPGVKVLRFDRVRLGNILHLALRINVKELCVLEFDHAECAPQLLEFLAAEFAGDDTCLHTLSIISPVDRQTERFHTSLQGLLHSFSGLRYLHIHYEATNKIDVGCIANHGNTLKDLMLLNGGAFQHRLDASDVEAIVAACPLLEQLCVEIYMSHTNVRGGKTLFPSTHDETCEMTEFERAFQAIAGLKNLDMVRFTQHPTRHTQPRDFEYNEEFGTKTTPVELCQDLQTDADECKDVLAELESPIKVLAFAPTGEPYLPAMKHTTWPHFLYFMNKRVDKNGAEQLVAEPMKLWEDKFPHATILPNM